MSGGRRRATGGCSVGHEATGGPGVTAPEVDATDRAAGAWRCDVGRHWHGHRPPAVLVLEIVADHTAKRIVLRRDGAPRAARNGRVGNSQVAPGRTRATHRDL